MFDIDHIRSQFPALKRQIDGKPVIYLDNPAGTQVPQRVIDAVSNYYCQHNANQGGVFATSLATDTLLTEARQIVADMLCANNAAEIVFGPSMTALNFNLSRAIARTLPKDSEIVITRMDHDANVAPWLTIARHHNWTIRWVDFDPETGQLDTESLNRAITTKTQLVAAVHASNALGTINDVRAIAQKAQHVGALFVVDAVQSAPHVPIDVQQIGCDFLLCSAYKFFGPHIGVMWGKRQLLNELPVDKVRPAKDEAPFRWEQGTPSFETIAGTAEAVRYLASFATDDAPAIGTYQGRQQHLKQAFARLQQYETQLARQLITGLSAINGVTIAGITDLDQLEQRVATVIFTKEGITPQAIVQHLADHNIFAWAGDYYAVEVMKKLGREAQGMVRVGAVHYNTPQEIDYLLTIIEDI